MATRDYLKHTVSFSAPSNSTLGDEWYDPTNNTLYKRLAVNGTQVQFIPVSSTTVTGDNAPVSPATGTLWWNSAKGQLYVSYYDGDSQQWVVASKGSVGPTGATGATGATGPSGPAGANIPASTNTTVVAADAGKFLNVAAGVTFNTTTAFTVGDVVTIYNNSAANITITATGVTIRLASTATTGNRTLAQRGIATALCVAANEYVMSGAGLT